MRDRSPVIFWLLLTVMLLLDATAYSWQVANPHPSFGETFYLALVEGQLSVICLWSALGPTKSFLSRIAPWLAAIAVGVINGLRAPRTPDAISWVGYYGIYVACLLSALWILGRTDFWRRHSDWTTQWRYSVGQLLGTMTVVAFLVAATRRSEIFEDSYLLEILFLAASVLLAIATVVIWILPWHWILRFASVAAVSILLGAVWSFAFGRSGVEILMSHFLIKSTVISAWLATGHIIPIASRIQSRR